MPVLKSSELIAGGSRTILNPQKRKMANLAGFYIPPSDVIENTNNRRGKGIQNIPRTDKWKFAWEDVCAVNAAKNMNIMSDPGFEAACTRAGVQPTKRQASKWARKTGSAYARRGA